MSTWLGGYYDAGEDGREGWRVTGEHSGVRVTFLRSFDMEDFNKRAPTGGEGGCLFFVTRWDRPGGLCM